MRIRHGLLILLIALSLAGCVGLSAPFEDDFSDPASGWAAASHETHVRGYQGGQYLIQIDVPQQFVWAIAGRRYKDVSIGSQIRSEGITDNHYGLLCRYTEGNFYYFTISTDGYYGIFRRVGGGELESLSGSAMLRSSQIRTDGTANHMLAICEAQTLTLYVNGVLVSQVEDDALSKGDIGMAAGTLNQGGTVVWFDNFKADRPEGGE